MKKIIVIGFLLLAIFSLKAYSQAGTAQISGSQNFLTGSDSVMLSTYKYTLFDDAREFKISYKTHPAGQNYHFNITVGAYPCYFSILISLKRQEKNLYQYIAEAGDDVRILNKENSYEFTGPGSAKYNLINQLRLIRDKWYAYYNLGDPDHIRREFAYKDTSALEQLTFLKNSRGNISAVVYKLLKAEILGNWLSKGFYISRQFNGDVAKPFITNLAAYEKNPLLAGEVDALLAEPELLTHTLFFPESIIERYRLDSCFLKGKEFNSEVTNCYEYLKRNFQGKLRNYLVTLLIYDRKNLSLDFTYMINDALSFVYEEDFRKLLLNLRSSRLKGQLAYNFSLTGEDGKELKLEQLRGKVVLLDFWYTGCPSCALTAPYLAKMEPEFSKMPVVFVSICIDKDKRKWLESLKEGKYTSSYNLNLYTGGSGKHHPAIEMFNISAYPTLLLIDKTGRLCEPVGDPRSDDTRRLTGLINEALTK
jgi:thiol-disulfide isomerase/thioredoxin